MGNRTVSKLRRNMLLKGGLDRAYGKRAVQDVYKRQVYGRSAHLSG